MTAVATDFMVPTEHRPYTTVDALPGMGFKHMNTLENPRIWSAVIRIETGQVMPKRHNRGLCEILIVRGKGRYADGQSFSGGDYLRETTGDYEPIEAQQELVFFVTHHGECTFSATDGSAAFVADLESIGAMAP